MTDLIQTSDFVHVVSASYEEYTHDVHAAGGFLVPAHFTVHKIFGYVGYCEDGVDKRIIIKRIVDGDAYAQPDMREWSHNNIINDLRSAAAQRGLKHTINYCMCGHRRGGYTRLNEYNDWGCSRCRKPSRLVYHGHMLRREIEQMENTLYGSTA